MDEERKWMAHCYELAETAGSEGESPVGCVVVKNNRIIGMGSEKSRQLKDITRHAEVVALLDAVHKGENLEGATLYTNVEPCLLCSYAIRHYKISKVVFAKYSGALGGTNEPFNLLTTNNLESWGKAPEVVVFSGNNQENGE